MAEASRQIYDKQGLEGPSVEKMEDRTPSSSLSPLLAPPPSPYPVIRIFILLDTITTIEDMVDLSTYGSSLVSKGSVWVSSSSPIA